MAGPTVGYATLQVIPSLKGVQKSITSEMTGAGSAAGDAASKTFGSRFSAGLKTAAKVGAVAFTAALGGAIAIGSKAIDSASTLEQAIGKVDAVFGDSAAEIRDWAKTAATAFGQSESQALAAAGTYGNLFQAFGIGQEPAQEMSQTLVELAADLAAFNDTTVDEALLALRSGLSGETEPLKRFGVALNDARLKQVALEMGIWDGTGALDAAQKAQAAYNLILQDTTIAQGAFSRESDSLSARQMVLSAQWENMKASIGQALIPAMSAVVGFIAGSLIPRVKELAAEWMPRVASAIDAVASALRAALPTIVGILGGLRDAFVSTFGWFIDHQPIMIGVAAALGVGIVAMFTAWAASALAAAAATLAAAAPFIAIGAVIAGVVAGVVYAYQEWEWFRETVDKVRAWMIDTLWPAIKTVGSGVVAVFSTMTDAVKKIVDGAVAVIQAAWDNFGGYLVAAIQNYWNTISGVVQGALDFVRGIIQTVTALIRGDWDGVWNGIKTSLSGIWDGITAIVTGALEAIQIAISAALTLVQLTITGAWDLIKAGAQAAWDWVSTTIVDTWDGLVDFMGSIPGRMMDALGDMVQWGRDVIAAIVEGIKAAAHQITDAIKDAIPSPKDLVGGVVGGIKGAGKAIIPGLATGGFAGVGSTVMVGEDGPELMKVTARGAYVTDSRTTRMLLADRANSSQPGPAVSIGTVVNNDNVDVAAFWQQANAYARIA